MNITIVRTPADGATLWRQVEAALARGLPQQPVAPLQMGALTIVTNGPSARALPDSILSRPNTMAINGAIKLFTARGLAPKWWLALDPQALVANFLTDAPQRTRYLVASQCHDAVFDALAERNVRVWHVLNPAFRDLIPDRPAINCGLTATLASIAVSRALLGFRKVDIHGWDACRIWGADHAVPQGFAGRPCKTAIGVQVFDTSPDWIAELDDARQRLQFIDTRATIHGPGLAGAYLRHLGIAA